MDPRRAPSASYTQLLRRTNMLRRSNESAFQGNARIIKLSSNAERRNQRQGGFAMSMTARWTAFATLTAFGFLAAIILGMI